MTHLRHTLSQVLNGRLRFHRKNDKPTPHPTKFQQNIATHCAKFDPAVMYLNRRDDLFVIPIGGPGQQGELLELPQLGVLLCVLYCI